MMQDPTVAAANKEMMYQSRVGAPDTAQRDAMIKQLQEERSRQVGPQDSFGQLMEYLGQVASTPRGMSSFEAGAAGARGVQGLETQRAQKRFDLGTKIIEQEQGKIDASRQYAKEAYGVGEKEYDQIFKAQYEAAKQVSNNETEARKLAQEEALKMMELKQRADLDRERMKNNLSVANIGQTRERNEQARIDKITSLKQRARSLEATNPNAAKELMAQATDLEMAVGRGGAGGSSLAGVGAERNDISRKRLQIQTWKDIRDGATNPQAIAEAEKNILQLARDIAKIESNEAGGGAGTGGVPLPPDASAKNLKVGTVYQTARGPAKWTGTGFMPI
jgi:hypothetical protein